MRVWCANADYWTVYYDLMDGFKAAFDAAGIEMTLGCWEKLVMLAVTMELLGICTSLLSGVVSLV